MRLTLPLVALHAAVLAAGLAVVVPERPADRTGVASSGQAEPVRPAPTATEPTSAGALPPATTRPAPPATTPRVQPEPSPSPTAEARVAAPVQRVVTKTGFQPYARVGPVTLHFPGNVVEVVGLHQSGHDGAQQQLPVKSRARIGSLNSRSRDTNPNGAADIVVDPTGQVRAPVTGTVIRAGSYTLYCDHVDDYVVIEPAARPGWEVKLLHFEGLRVSKGDTVRAGVTVVGTRARVLPFASQVDKHTVAPHWPHLHVEVVDPSIPDRPSGGSCD